MSCLCGSGLTVWRDRLVAAVIAAGAVGVFAARKMAVAAICPARSGFPVQRHWCWPWWWRQADCGWRGRDSHDRQDCCGGDPSIAAAVLRRRRQPGW